MAKTPRGVFKWCHLNKPDTRFGEPGEFTVTVLFAKDDPKTQAMLEKLDELHSEAEEKAQEEWKKLKPAAKKKLAQKNITAPILMPYYEDEVDDDDNPTGKVEIKFKTKAQYVNKKGKTVDKVVALYDGRGNIIPAKKRPLVYGGTVGAIDFNPVIYWIAAQGMCGLTLYLNSVRISQLVSNSGGWDEDDESDFSAEDLDEIESIDDEDDDDNEFDLDDDLDGGDDEAEDEDDLDLDDEIPL